MLEQQAIEDKNNNLNNEYDNDELIENNIDNDDLDGIIESLIYETNYYFELEIKIRKRRYIINDDLFSKKIKHLSDIEYKNHVLCIYNKETDNRLTFSLYDKINVSLITYPNEKQFNKKLLIYCH